MIKQLLLLFCLVSITLSCTKEDPLYPQTYTFSSIDATPIRLFSSEGEITETAKIEQFLSSKKFIREQNVFIEEDASAHEPSISFRFISPDSVELLNILGGYAYRTVKQKDDVNYLEFYQTLSTPKSSFNTFNTSLFYTYQPFWSSTDSADIYYHQKPCMYYLQVENALHFPYVNYITTKAGKLNALWRINNSFNIDYLNEMTDGDTLCVQNYTAIFDKK